ncbi:STAS domain-containing protein [Pseudonocardia acaciae]|uniref:STAS domain-containing protein n=1 Tax=Pseudonocardia acaciae TaxID=551276 RepID=UPI0004902AEA|nr:STAS domain-containing protein [Pseudonocardia acaciae]
MTDPSAEDPISIQIEEPMPGTSLLRVAGEVDMLTSPMLRDGVADALALEPRLLVIELDGIEFLGTSGLAALFEARDEASRRGCELRLVCSSRRVLRPLEIAGLIDLFKIAESVPGALAGAGSDSG